MGGAPRWAPTALAALTEQELATLAAYENYFAKTDRDLLEQFVLLWSLAASTSAPCPCAPAGVAPTSPSVSHDADRHESRRGRGMRVLQATVVVAIAFAALAFVVLVGMHTMAAIASSAARGLG